MQPELPPLVQLTAQALQAEGALLEATTGLQELLDSEGHAELGGALVEALNGLREPLHRCYDVALQEAAKARAERMARTEA